MFFGLFRKKENTGTEVTLRQEKFILWLDAPKNIPCRIKVFDLAGHKVLDYTINTNNGVGIRCLSKSLYTVCVTTEDGFKLKKQIAIGIEL